MANMEEKITKLEIGSGEWPHAGYTHLDIEPHKNVDIVGDFRTMHFEDLEEICAYHLLEHFDRKEVIDVLKLWHSWLKIGGRLIVEVPDFERICKLWGHTRVWANKEWMVKHAFGSQESEWAFHKDGWYEDKFRDIFPKIGFEIELLKTKHSYVRYNERNERWRLPNMLVIAKKV